MEHPLHEVHFIRSVGFAFLHRSSVCWARPGKGNNECGIFLSNFRHPLIDVEWNAGANDPATSTSRTCGVIGRPERAYLRGSVGLREEAVDVDDVG